MAHAGIPRPGFNKNMQHIGISINIHLNLLIILKNCLVTHC